MKKVVKLAAICLVLVPFLGGCAKRCCGPDVCAPRCETKCAPVCVESGCK